VKKPKPDFFGHPANSGEFIVWTSLWSVESALFFPRIGNACRISFSLRNKNREMPCRLPSLVDEGGTITIPGFSSS
jgi:hypothetical protein